jgi:hypothetical protein
MNSTDCLVLGAEGPVSRSSFTLAAIEFAVGETRTIQKCWVPAGARRAPSWELGFTTKDWLTRSLA